MPSNTSICYEGRDLLLRFLNLEASKRISSQEALNHPYFNDIDKFQLDAFIDNIWIYMLII